MSVLREAGAAVQSTTDIGGYGSPRSRGRRNHECLCCAKLGPQFCLRQALVAMGPRVRGDDAKCAPPHWTDTKADATPPSQPSCDKQKIKRRRSPPAEATQRCGERRARRDA